MRYWALIAVAALCCDSALAADLVPLPAAVESGNVARQPVIVQQPGRITLILENDALVPSQTDRWYTQGFALSYLSAPVAGSAFDWLFPTTFLSPNASRTRRFEIIVGQSIFTPANLRINPPDPKDRPYAGWLYTGVSWYQEANRQSLDHLQLLVGVVGPGSLAQQVQTAYHNLVPGQVAPQGWSTQLKNEPGVVLSYEHKWRLDMPLGGGMSIDAIPEIGGSVGNVFTYGQVGVMVRLGQNLKADYGPARIRPALSGTSWFDASALDGPLGWYLFVGAQGRAVARNIFLDGNTFTSSARVDKNVLVGDVSAGASVFWLDYAKLDFVFTARSKEFVGQADYERFGGINLSFRLP